MTKKESNRRYYLKNRERILERNKKWYARPENQERIGIARRRAQKKYQATPKGYHKAIKRNGEKRGLEVLSQKEFLDWYKKQDKVCVYCGIAESLLQREFLEVKGVKVARLTIDRVDNDLGYLEENMVLACYRCNQTKGDFFSYKEMKELAISFIKPKWIKFLS